MGSDRDAVLAAYDEWEAAFDQVAGLSLDALSHTELLALLHRREVLARRHAAGEHQLIGRLVAEADPKALGGKNLADLLSTAMRISTKDAKGRIAQASLLGPRTAMTGEPLAPELPNVAAAQARGDIGAEHVRRIEKFFHELPARIDYATREAAEAHLARIAAGLGPEQFRQAADRLALLLNQDGELPDEADRARRRYFTLEKQDVDGLTRAHGLLDPEARATLEPILAKLGAPGMCNPDDEHPCVDGEPSEDAVHGDMRSPGQRNHDALKAMGRAVLARASWAISTGCRLRSSSPPPCRIWKPPPGSVSPPVAACYRCATSSGKPAKATTTWWSTTNMIPNSSTVAAPNASPPQGSASCYTPWSEAAPAPAAPHRATGARSTTSTAGLLPMAKPTSTPRPWPAGPTIGSSKKAAGPPENDPTAAPNGPLHPTSTPAKPGSTTTTTPRNTYYPKKTRDRSPIRSARHVNENGLGRDGGDDVVHRAGRSRIHPGERLTLAHRVDHALIQWSSADLVHDDVETL
jgi:hypothetical protein